MIDIHCHILPGVDDGPKSMEESLQMARIAAKDGIKIIVSTSHFIDESKFISGEPLKNRVESLNEKLKEEGIALTVLLGNEVYMSPQLPTRLENSEIFTINNSRYLLIELPFSDIPIYMDETIYQLKLKGITPIIAHPERYGQIIEQPNIVYEWINKGVLIQINAGSLKGRFGPRVKEVSQILLKHNLVHFIASDGHSANGRKPKLSDAVFEASEIIGKNQALKLVTDNVHAVIRDQELEIAEPIEIIAEQKMSKLKFIFNKIFISKSC